jgi:hypothetical protein
VGELLGQADAILDVSEAATAAAIAAAKGSVWAGTSSFMDIMLWTHDGIGLPWWVVWSASRGTVPHHHHQQQQQQQ